MSKLLPSKFLFCLTVLFSFVSQAQNVVSESDIVRQPEGTDPTNDWVGYTRAGTPPTALQFVNGPGNPPLGCGSVLLTTATFNEKVFLYNYDYVDVKLSDINQISYSTYRIATELPQQRQVTGLNIQIDYNGDAPGGNTTLVFEPVYNPDQGEVTSGAWQTWTATGSGVWWSTAPINGQCAGAFPQCYRSWDEILADNPDAVIVGGVGLNQGSGNTGLVSAVDAFTFDETTYNFEPSADSDGDGAGDACDTDDDNDGVPDAQDCAPSDPKNDKVIVCHNGKEICVSQNAVAAHLQHGDQVGPCTTTTVMATQASRSRSRAAAGGNELFGNTPNPFRAATELAYHLAADSRISLKVFDIMGREVATVVDAQKPAGRHTAAFRPEGLRQGVYFYRLTAISGGKVFEQTRSMLVW